MHEGNVPSRRGYRSLFWPVVLIGVGLIWLLSNLGLIGAVNLRLLLRLWPLILIVLGFDLLIGRRSTLLSALVALVALAVVVAVLVAGPAWGLVRTPEVKTEQFSEPLGEATSARITLDLAEAPTTITALEDSNQLIDATLTHLGRIIFTIQGTREKTVSLHQEVDFNDWDWADLVGAEPRWEIGLSPRIPLALTLNGGSGSSTVDLSALQLTALNADLGSGHSKWQLPARPDRYTANLRSGSGHLEVTVAPKADVELTWDSGSGAATLNLEDNVTAELAFQSGSGSVTVKLGKGATVDGTFESGSGSVTVILPEGAAVRVEVRDDGSSRVRLPANFKQVSDANDDDEDTGIWETANFEQAERPIVLVVEEIGSGNFTVRY